MGHRASKKSPGACFFVWVFTEGAMGEGSGERELGEGVEVMVNWFLTEAASLCSCFVHI